MSPLRKLLKHPATYLAILVLLAAAACADSFRAPDRQLTSRAYIALVRGYQSVGSPSLDPLCSVPLPSHLLPLFHRNRAALRIAPGSSLDRGPPLALPQKRSSWHRRPGPLAGLGSAYRRDRIDREGPARFHHWIVAG
jgi:hypothetical protein